MYILHTYHIMSYHIMVLVIATAKAEACQKNISEIKNSSLQTKKGHFESLGLR